MQDMETRWCCCFLSLSLLVFGVLAYNLPCRSLEKFCRWCMDSCKVAVVPIPKSSCSTKCRYNLFKGKKGSVQSVLFIKIGKIC